MRLTVIAASILMSGAAFYGTAEAATISSLTTTLPADNYQDPTIVTNPGKVHLNETGSLGGQYASPFKDTTSAFIAIEPGGSVEYDFASLSSALSLIWGSPDSYNTITFFDGSTKVDSIKGSQLGSAALSYFVEIATASAFNRVVLTSASPAFEFSNLTAVSAVPLPAALPMFGAALLGLGAIGAGFRRKSSASTAA